MSKCISREGEYSEHELAEKPEFVCARCYVFDDDAAVAEVARLRAALASREAEAGWWWQYGIVWGDEPDAEPRVTTLERALARMSAAHGDVIVRRKVWATPKPWDWEPVPAVQEGDKSNG